MEKAQLAGLINSLKILQSQLIAQNLLSNATNKGVLDNLDRVTRQIFTLEKLLEHQKKLNGIQIEQTEGVTA